MSLGRLLASGKSLIGAYGGPHRFRENRRAMLPKFGSPKNPFTSGAQQERAEARPTAAVPTEAKVRANNAPASPVALRKLSPTRAIKWVREVGQKLNPLARLKSRPVRSANATAVPVQRELSLESVRVLRNDLSDADAETIPPIKPAPRNSGVLAMTAKAEVVMDKLSSRFFGANDA